jgi:methionine aminopeptidase
MQQKTLTLAQKRKLAKDLLKATTDKVVKAIEHMPEGWDGIEIRAYIAKQFEDEDVSFALRGNTARGRVFTAEMAKNRGL